MASVSILKQISEDIAIYEIKTEDLIVHCTNFGGHIISIFSKDKDGNMGDVLLGYEDTIKESGDGCYLGAVVGRVANRIAKGTFELNGVTYNLAINNGPNSLHGGLVGFDQKVFAAKEIEDGVEFTYVSPDMEEGYPGTLELKVTYTVKGDTLSIAYDAQSDKDTLVNFTNHMYFNLNGITSPVYDHELCIQADQFAAVDDTCLATGEFVDVEGTPFDFKEFHTIGERIHDDYEQLILAAGYDHSFLLKDMADQVVLQDPATGRKLSITTDMPACQIYTGNYLKGGNMGKGGQFYDNRDGVAIETQLLPDSIHIEKEPKAILRAGEKFHSVSSYRFTNM